MDKGDVGDLPGGPVVKTSPSNAGSTGSIPGQGAKIPHASGPKNQNIKQKQYDITYIWTLKIQQTNEYNKKEADSQI